jgi:hypothetical protein
MNDLTVDELYRSEPVQRWFRSAHLDDEPEGELKARVQLLASFCDRLGEAPGALLQRCLRVTPDGQLAISIKGRRELDKAINDFGDSLNLGRHQNIAAGNTVRSFLIHNGVLMQGRPSL